MHAASRTFLAAAVLVALLASPAAADCTPGSPAAVEEAERKARDAETKAQQAESIAVRSGNTGAAARAELARQAASAARQELDRLRCQEATGEPAAPEPAGETYPLRR